MRTNGISPKVLYPVLVNLAIGAALLALGEQELGIGLLLAVATNAGLGYAARPGDVSAPLITMEYDEDGLPVD